MRPHVCVHSSSALAHPSLSLLPCFSHAVFSSLHLKVRDVADNPEWQAKYASQIPVLAVLHKGKEVRDESSLLHHKWRVLYTA